MSTPAQVTPAGAAARFIAAPHRMLIGGDWRDAVSGARLDVRDPATGEILTTVPAADRADVDAAVQAARTAFESREWGAARPVDRERWLLLPR
jgi:acyl-CoA reductase-like NAD-dependent aldehyde dehydrogenase